MRHICQRFTHKGGLYEVEHTLSGATISEIVTYGGVEVYSIVHHPGYSLEHSAKQVVRKAINQRRKSFNTRCIHV